MYTIILNYLLAGRYLAVFLGAFFEGPTVMATVGFFIKTGHFSFWPAYLLLLSGDLLADVMWYYIGRHGASYFIKHFGRFFGYTTEAHDRVLVLFKRYDYKILVISKLTMGFGFSLVTLMTAGMAKIPLRKFMFYNFLGGLVWVLIPLSLGYFVGNVYYQVAEGLRYIFIGGVLLVLIGGLYGLNKYFRKKFSQL
jgi:membrane protein DedA with SNARE-associated domain